MIATPAWIVLVSLTFPSTDVAQTPPAATTNPPAVAPDAKQQEGTDLRAIWKDGFRLESADKQFALRLFGRVDFDSAWFSGDEEEFVSGGVGELNDGSEVRRARIGVEGKIYGDIDYRLEVDFARASNDLADVYLQTATDIGSVRVGHFKQPIGLEELTSSNYITFMERSLAQAFVLNRDDGIQLADSFAGEAVAWQVGAFRDSNANGFSSSATSDDEYIFTGRVASSPWYADDGSKLLHVGVAASHRNPSGNGTTFSSKPEADLAPNFITTGALADADDYDLVGLELATVLGPVSLQGEYMQAMVNGTSPGGDDPDLKGYYVYASYFLTGEHRPYKRSTGVFDRVKPEHNYGKKDGSGWGAWEVGLRYSHLDFSEATAGDSTMSDVTAGINWYLNPFTRIQFNVVQANLDQGSIDDEDATIYQVRFHYDF